jgi:hypothetical protein
VTFRGIDTNRRTAAMHTVAAVLLSGALSLCAACKTLGFDSRPGIALERADDAEAALFRVCGLDPVTMEAMGTLAQDDARWPGVFAVYALPDADANHASLPPMNGNYSVGSGGVAFQPRYPIRPGMTYRAIFRADAIRSTENAALVRDFAIPAPPKTPKTRVEQVYPSSDVLPENLLKFYVHFSGPMSSGDVYRFIRLVDEAGAGIELPFLELEQELWNREMTRLTLFIDPGRIKREVRPLEEIGPALQEGHAFTLIVDRAWPDADGDPLVETHRNTFRVGAPDRATIDLQRWEIRPPAAHSTGPLVVLFEKSLDHGLAMHTIEVVQAGGESIGGRVVLSEHERRWAFTPEEAWRAGSYMIVIQTILEDLAGNNIFKPFEVDLKYREDYHLNREPYRLEFEVR